MQGLNFDEFVDALVVTALHAYAHQRYSKRYPQPEQKVEALLSLLGLQRPEELLPMAGPGNAPMDNMLGAAADPYKEWWELDLDSAGVAHGQGPVAGSQSRLALILEVVVPPEECLLAARRLLQDAFEAHAERQLERAIKLYQQARAMWMQRAPYGRIPADAQIYFATAMGSVHATAGRDELALQLCEAVSGAVERLPESHESIALLHSCMGTALYHLGHYKPAFERLVKAMVMRQVCPAMGKDHPATLLVCHNLACVLEALGLTAKALKLLQGAHAQMVEALGSSHPRSIASGRNVDLLTARCKVLAHLPAKGSSGSAAAGKGPVMGGIEGMLLRIQARQARLRADPFSSLQEEEPNGFQQLAKGILGPSLSAKQAYQTVSTELELRRSWQKGKPDAEPDGGQVHKQAQPVTAVGAAASSSKPAATVVPEQAKTVLRRDATLAAVESVPLGRKSRASMAASAAALQAPAGVNVPLRSPSGQKLTPGARKALLAAATERVQEHKATEAMLKSWKGIEEQSSSRAGAERV